MGQMSVKWLESIHQSFEIDNEQEWQDRVFLNMDKHLVKC